MNLSDILTIISIVITILGIIITIFEVVIPIKYEKKSKLPILSLSQPIFGCEPNRERDNKNDYVLHGYFKSNIEYDEKLHEFLKNNNCDFVFCTQHIMERLYENYKNKKYLKETSYFPDCEINSILKDFDKNRDLLKLIREFEKYWMSSCWNLKIMNSGQTPAIDFQIDLFKENSSGMIGNNGTFYSNSCKSIILYYFDKSLSVVDGAFVATEDKNTFFYLIEEKKYNKKDERLFLITYKDVYDRVHKIYCCSKIDKNPAHHIMGAK